MKHLFISQYITGMGVQVIVYTYNGGVYEFKKALVSKDSDEKMFAYVCNLKANKSIKNMIGE